MNVTCAILFVILCLGTVMGSFGGARPFNQPNQPQDHQKGRRAVPDESQAMQYKLPGIHRFGRAAQLDYFM